MCIFNNCWKALSWHLPWQLHDYSFSWSKGGHSNTWEKSTYHQEEEMKFYIGLENTYAQPEKFTQGLCSWNLPPSVNTQDSIMILAYSLATFSNLPLPASPVFSVFPSCALFCKLCFITYTSCAPYINKKLWPPRTEILLPIYCEKFFSSFTLLDSYKQRLKVWEFHLQPKQKTNDVEICCCQLPQLCCCHREVSIKHPTDPTGSWHSQQHSGSAE